MKILVDSNLPIAIARWLQENGHVALHTSECNLLSATDQEIWDAADKIGAAILTKDADFASRQSSANAPQIVWIRLGNTTTKALLKKLAPIWPEILTKLEKGEPLIEVL